MGLKILVAGMGVLIVLGTALVIGVVVHRMVSAPLPAGAARPPAPAPADISPSLAPGEHIKSVAAAGPDLAIWVAGPAGERILIYDPQTAHLTVAVRAAP